jgi:hypothetical protein
MIERPNQRKPNWNLRIGRVEAGGKINRMVLDEEQAQVLVGLLKPQPVQGILSVDQVAYNFNKKYPEYALVGNQVDTFLKNNPIRLEMEGVPTLGERGKKRAKQRGKTLFTEERSMETHGTSSSKGSFHRPGGGK